MKKLFALILISVMLLSCTAAFAQEAPANLLTNPGFEVNGFEGSWLNYYHYNYVNNDIIYTALSEDAHSGAYAAWVKDATSDGQGENEWWLSAIGLEATEMMKAAGNGEYFFKAFVKLLGSDKFASCDAWLYIYDQARTDAYSPVQVWKLESNTPVDALGWNEVGFDADGNDKCFQLWYNSGADHSGKEPTQQPGATEILVDDFDFTHAILWVTCGMDGSAAMNYLLDDAQFYVKPIVK